MPSYFTLTNLANTDTLTDEQHEIVETAAEVLYGLIHARYILSSAAMQKMVSEIQRILHPMIPY